MIKLLGCQNVIIGFDAKASNGLRELILSLRKYPTIFTPTKYWKGFACIGWHENFYYLNHLPTVLDFHKEQGILCSVTDK